MLRTYIAQRKDESAKHEVAPAEEESWKPEQDVDQRNTPPAKIWNTIGQIPFGGSDGVDGSDKPTVQRVQAQNRTRVAIPQNSLISRRIIQRTVKEAIAYYNAHKTAGPNANKEGDVDLSNLPPGKRSWYTRLKNRPAGHIPPKAGGAKRKVGSATGGTYRLKNPQQIRVNYTSTKARFVRSERKARHSPGKYSGLNYATAKVNLVNKANKKDKATRYITRSSADASTHSEGAIMGALRELNKTNDTTVEWVYTEREACGPDNQNCRGDNKLGDTSLFGKNVPIYYSVDWPDSKDVANAKDARKEGTNLLKRVDTQVGKSGGIHPYGNAPDVRFHPTEDMQVEDAGVVTSDDESGDESDVLSGGFEGARKGYKELP